MFFNKLKVAPLHYWEEKSYITVITEETDNNLILKNILDRISKSKCIKILDSNTDYTSQSINFNLKFKKKNYEVGIYIGDFRFPEFYLSFISVSDEKREKLLNSKKGVTIFMKFDDDVKTSYHLQLKLANLLVPDMLAILDESSERVFPSEWVKLASESDIAPSSKDLFTVQLIRDKTGPAWLHTHGLLRCGISELEILGSSVDSSRSHFNLISSYAMYLIDKKTNTEGGDYIGRLQNGMPIVLTQVPWIDSLKYYKHLKSGGKKDRKSSHNTKTNVIFLYTSEENEKNNVFTKITNFDELLKDNPLYFVSDDETNRMKSVAIERFDYVKKALKNKKYSILLKIGLHLEEEGQYEHIWFELIDLKKNKIKAKLTQEPYYFKGMHTGDIGEYKISDITDWIIYTEDTSITPDSAYLLD